MLTLSLSVQESNDSKSLILTDNSGEGTTGWNGITNPAVTDIRSTLDYISWNNVYVITLEITRKSSTEEIVYDTINLYDLNGGGFTTVDDLVFTITPMELLVDGVVESGVTADSKLIDGIYEIRYHGVGYDWGDSNDIEYNVTLLLYNQIKTKVYQRLRIVPEIYNAYDSRSKEISDTLLQYVLLRSMDASAYVALEQELLNTLETINKINTNGSNYTWQ